VAANLLGVILYCSTALTLTACGDDSSDAPPSANQPIRLTDSPQHLVLPAHMKYGIYINDANNSGYSLKCSGTDADGTPIHMNYNPPPNVSTSATQTLDVVYNTGSGDITLACSTPGATATTRALP
jgi:hypothetical protein